MTKNGPCDGPCDGPGDNAVVRADGKDVEEARINRATSCRLTAFDGSAFTSDNGSDLAPMRVRF